MTDYQNKHHKQRLNFMQRLLVRSLIYGANSWSTIETIPQSTRTIGISANYPPINNNDIIGFNRNTRCTSLRAANLRMLRKLRTVLRSS